MTDPEQGAHSRPEPVLQAANMAGNISAIIGALSTILTAYAAITGQQWAVQAAAFLVAVATGLAKYLPTGFAQGARAQVTPLTSPRGMDGSPLAPLAVAAPRGDYAPSMGPDL